MPHIDFWYSIGSTYSYLTVMRLPAVARATGIAFAWRPFDVRAIMIEQKNIPFRNKPSKTAYMWRDIERRAPVHGLAPQIPAPYPLADLTFANQVARLGIDEGWGEAFTTAAYANWFEKGQPPDHGDGLADALRAAGQDPDTTIARARTDMIADRLASETRIARDLGVFGSPTFAIAGELFWGDDRLEDAIAWAQRGTLA